MKIDITMAELSTISDEELKKLSLNVVLFIGNFTNVKVNDVYDECEKRGFKHKPGDMFFH